MDRQALETHGDFMERAIELSRRCVPSQNAFSVGAMIVDSNLKLISSGFSRELNDHCHAEEAAIIKAIENKHNLSGCTIYSTIEPCSVRLSGRVSCCHRLISLKLSKVYFAVREPSTFVKCNAVELLKQNQVEVVHLEKFAAEVLAINSHLEQK